MTVRSFAVVITHLPSPGGQKAELKPLNAAVVVYRPIHDAVEADSIATVRLLLCAGADVTMKTYSGDTVLHLAKSAEMKRFIEGLLIYCFIFQLLGFTHSRHGAEFYQS